MIDGVKLECNYLRAGEWLENPLLNFPISIDRKTGEEIRAKTVDTYQGLHFEVMPSKDYLDLWHYNMRGSLHRYWNEGAPNNNEFPFVALLQAIENMERQFSIVPRRSILRNLEFGVNLVLPMPVKQFLKMVVSLPNMAFAEMKIDKKKLGKIARRSQYDLKLYDKGLQTGAEVKNLLRVEIKVKKMQWLKTKGISITTLEDLKSPRSIFLLSKVLINTFQEVIIFQRPPGLEDLPDKKQLDIERFSNPAFWEGAERFQRSRYKARLQKLNAEMGVCRAKESVLSKMVETLTRLLIFQQIHPQHFYRNLGLDSADTPATFLQLEYRVKRLLVELNKKKSKKGRKKGSHYLDIFAEKLPGNSRTFCASCKRDISHQKKGSKYCSEKYQGSKGRRCRNRGNYLERKKRESEKVQIQDS